MRNNKLQIAIPDGHLMTHICPFLENAGIKLEGYCEEKIDYRPVLKLLSDKAKSYIKRPDLLSFKVIRPQDMPIHVSNSNFDIAISGQDWCEEQMLRFPSSPILFPRVFGNGDKEQEAFKLGFGKVRIVAAIHEKHENSVTDYIMSFRKIKQKEYFRVATEYVYIANDYAKRNNLNPYKIIMTYGATESMIPEDCDMIVENTETGNTIRQNNLKIIDQIMESEACFVVHKGSWESENEIVTDVSKKNLIRDVITLFNDFKSKSP